MHGQIMHALDDDAAAALLTDRVFIGLLADILQDVLVSDLRRFLLLVLWLAPVSPTL